MREPALADACRLTARARELYADDPGALEALEALDARLQGPLRIALAGMVKAGKSTLLNALVGEQIAATDAGECTRAITWYRRARTPSVTLHLHEGGTRHAPFRRDAGELVIDLGDTTADEIERIDVGWPSEGLRSLVLIDTPGIASLSAEVSARSTDFLTGRGGASSADAVVYLMRHFHAADRAFLEAFRDAGGSGTAPVNAVAVLSRSDEIGAARIDSLLSAGQVARRYGAEADLQALVLDVIPVAGLVAETARTLREDEFRALAAIAALGRAAREKMLVSADRFARATDEVAIPEDLRRRLLARFGLFGVRLSAALIRGGAASSTALADELAQQSGLDALQGFIRDSFRARAETLKVWAVLPAIEALVRERPRAGDADVLRDIERIFATAHSLRELPALSRTRGADSPALSAEQLAEAARIVGGTGVDPRSRLGLDDSADARAVRARAFELLERWRALAASPLTDHSVAELCHVVVRSLEQIVSRRERSVVPLMSNDVLAPS